MELKLRTTGRKMPFLDIDIGAPFYAHGEFWVRVSGNTGVILMNSDGGVRSYRDFLLDGVVLTDRHGHKVVCGEVEIVEICT